MLVWRRGNCGRGGVWERTLVYTNDIHKSDSEASFHLFADDISLSFADKNIRRLEAKINTSLENIKNWLKAIKLTLNIDKSQLLLFELSPTTNKADALNIQINSQKLEQSESVRYLGVVIDNKLNWKSHIEYINHKVNIGIGIVKQLRYYVQEETLINHYRALIKPHIDYGILAWSSANRTNLKTIERTMNKAIRLMGFKKNLIQ